MARRTRRDTGSGELRSAILVEQLQLWANVLTVREVAEYLDAFERGDAVTIHRDELPDWHPERHVGHPSDALLLDVDNRLKYPYPKSQAVRLLATSYTPDSGEDTSVQS